MTLKYLVTGATGGLGAQVLSHLAANVPASQYAAASSTEANRKRFEDRGIAFRVVDYDDRQSMESAFQGVENLLFVSTNTFDVEKRRKQHQNFVDAAKQAKVQHVGFQLKPCQMSQSNQCGRCGTHRSPLEDSAPTLRQMYSKPI